jgi:hypothetical protein
MADVRAEEALAPSIRAGTRGMRRRLGLWPAPGGLPAVYLEKIKGVEGGVFFLNREDAAMNWYQPIVFSLL